MMRRVKMPKMTRNEFIELCTRCGYCNKKEAKAYAGDRDIFTDDDFIAVSRTHHDKSDFDEYYFSKKWDVTEGGRTTKRYSH